jgi:acyl-CoA synthetase (AMP-forming)/AMP-acid ligase II
LLSTLYSGGSVVIQPGKFSATTFWRDFLSNECTWYSAVPTIHQILLARADKDYTTSGKLRFIRSCSSALAPGTHPTRTTAHAPRTTRTTRTHAPPHTAYD